MTWPFIFYAVNFSSLLRDHGRYIYYVPLRFNIIRVESVTLRQSSYLLSSAIPNYAQCSVISVTPHSRWWRCRARAGYSSMPQATMAYANDFISSSPVLCIYPPHRRSSLPTRLEILILKKRLEILYFVWCLLAPFFFISTGSV